MSPTRANDFQSLLVDDGYLVITGCRGKDPSQLRDGDDAVDTMETIQVRDDFAFLCIENNQLIRIHVRDVEASVQGIQTLIVEAHRGPGQGHIGHCSKNFVRFQPGLSPRG